MAIASLAAGCASAPERTVDASEVQEPMSWQEGIQTLQDEVYNSPVETAITLVKYKDGSIKWLQGEYTEQTATKVKHNSANVEEEVRQDIINGQELESTCSIHTHPIEGLDVIEFLSEEEVDTIRSNFNNHQSISSISVPPSETDIRNIQIDRLNWINSLVHTGVYDEQVSDPDTKNVPQHYSMVMDPSGAWYFEFENITKLGEYFGKERAYVETADQMIGLVELNIEHLTEEEVAKLYELVAQQEQESPFLTELSDFNNKLETVITLGLNQNIADLVFETEEERELYANHLENLESKKELFEKFKSVVKEYVLTSRDGEVPEDITNALFKMYNSIGIKLRHVSNEDLANEPVCAGVGPVDQR